MKLTLHVMRRRVVGRVCYMLFEEKKCREQPPCPLPTAGREGLFSAAYFASTVSAKCVGLACLRER